LLIENGPEEVSKLEEKIEVMVKLLKLLIPPTVTVNQLKLLILKKKPMKEKD